MSWELQNGIYLKDGCWLEPVTPNRMANDSYATAQLLLEDNIETYKKSRPLLLPLGRGGFNAFLYMSGELRNVLNGTDIDYVPIKASRYKKGGMNEEGVPHVDEKDIEQASLALKVHEEVIIIDDIADRLTTIRMVLDKLPMEGRRTVVATPYTKTEAHMHTIGPRIYFVRDFQSREIDGVVYKPWVVFPWEKDDHDPELWRLLFPEFHPSPTMQEAIR